MSWKMDLKDERYAYFYGFSQADGNLYIGKKTPNKGKFSIELKSTDDDILFKIKDIIPFKSSIRYRERTTNFKECKTACFSVCLREFRDCLIGLGFPVGRKSENFKKPIVEFSEIDYIRGIIDGDGSLGFTAIGLPFLSLVTKNENLANYYIDFLEKELGYRKKCNRNKRDSVYNIMIKAEDAKKIITKLYYKDCFGLDRKIKIAKKILLWEQSEENRLRKEKRAKPKYWTKDEIEILLSLSNKDASKILDRSYSTIALKRKRIKLDENSK